MEEQQQNDELIRRQITCRALATEFAREVGRIMRAATEMGIHERVLGDDLEQALQCYFVAITDPGMQPAFTTVEALARRIEKMTHEIEVLRRERAAAKTDAPTVLPRVAEVAKPEERVRGFVTVGINGAPQSDGSEKVAHLPQRSAAAAIAEDSDVA